MKNFIILVVIAGVAGLAYTFFGTSNAPQNAANYTQQDGQQVYADFCADCHGANLEGETADWRTLKPDGTLPAPPHDGSGHTWHHGDMLLFHYTKEGGQAISGPGFKSGMPAFKGVLSDDQIWAVLNFIKSSWNEEQRYRQNIMTQRERQAQN